MAIQQDIYDFEIVIPRAVKAVLEDQDLRTFTIEDAIEFQKVRPRVEVVYRHMGEASPKRLAILPDGSKRTSCFRGELRIHAITDADEAGKLEHSRYRAFVRAAIAGLQDAVNGDELELHKIQFVTTGNEETGIRSADGYAQTSFPFLLDISIQADAWGSL